MKKSLTTNQQIAINLFSSFLAYAVSLSINFFLSPYIVRTIGIDAYGFVGLANNFISYLSLITVALNALAGRFIALHIYKNDYKTANKYYASVFYANMFLGGIMLLIEVFLWVFLEKLITIPENLLWDVKFLFASLFISNVVGTVSSVFGVAVFATNKLYLNSVRGIESNTARAIILILAYIFLAPKVYYLGFTSMLVTIYCSMYNLYYVKKLTPYLKLDKKLFDLSAIKELVSSGIWSLLNQLSVILTDGLDLLITNIFIDPDTMGVLSLAKTIPGIIRGIIGTMAGAFSPSFTKLYAEGKIEELTYRLKQSMKIMGVICNLPIIVLIVCGQRFFVLWQPTEDARLLQVLSILTCAGLIVNGGINCIFNIFTVVNKLRFNSLVGLACSMLSVLVTYILLKTTDLGVYAVAGVSTVLVILKNLFFIVPYGAKCLGLKKLTFYPEIIKSVLFVALGSAISIPLVRLISGAGWISLIICAAITGCISVAIGFFIILNKDDRRMLLSFVQGKLSPLRRKSK